MALAQCRAAVAQAVARAAGVPAAALLPWVERPRVVEHGDLAVPFARIAAVAKSVGVARPPPPSELAARISPDEYIARASDGGAFVNFHLDRSTLVQEVVRDVHRHGSRYGHADQPNGKLALVEFSSPNIAKPFHAGHLRSTILGNILSHLYRARGWQVLNVNYLGDWGTQFGLLSVGFRRYGDESLFSAAPIKHLYDVYVKINKDAERDDAVRSLAREAFARLEQGDAAELALWERFRAMSIKEYERLYEMLGVSFDVHDGESFHHKAAGAVTQELLAKGVAKEENGAVIADLGPTFGGPFVVHKTDDATTYISRDVAAALDRSQRYQFDRMVYVAGEAQSLHFKRVFALLRSMGRSEVADRVSHVGFGLVRGMSTRKGEVVFLEDILEEATAAVRAVIDSHDEKYPDMSPEQMDNMARQLGLSAVVVQDLTARRIKDYTFNWSRMTDARGDTGIYLQYAHARLMGIQRGYGRPLPDTAAIDLRSLAASEDAVRLAIEIAQFPDVVEAALARTEPSMLVHYLFELGHAFSTANNTLRVKDQLPSLADPRMLLFAAARITLANGLRMLGLRPLDVV